MMDWQKENVKPSERMDYSNYEYSLSLIVIDCEVRKWAIQKVISYGGNDEVISSSSDSSSSLF